MSPEHSVSEETERGHGPRQSLTASPDLSGLSRPIASELYSATHMQQSFLSQSICCPMSFSLPRFGAC